MIYKNATLVKNIYEIITKGTFCGKSNKDVNIFRNHIYHIEYNNIVNEILPIFYSRKIFIDNILRPIVKTKFVIETGKTRLIQNKLMF